MKIVNLSIAALLGAAAAAKPQRTADGKCRALALSGGSNYGSWEVGVLWGLLHYGEPADFAWDVITGVSAGAINTAATTVFETGDEVNMTEYLSDAWANLRSEDIWIKWPGESPERALFDQQGMLDSSPAVPFLKSLLSPFTEIKRRFTVAAVNVNTGDYETFDQTNTSFEDVPQACFSSGSIPTVFPNQHYKGMNLMDGGTVWNINIDSAINQCLEIVDSEEDIIIDVAICGYSQRTGHTMSSNAMENYMSARDEKSFYQNTNSIQQALAAYPGVDKRYYFQWSEYGHHGCHVDSQLDFNNSTTWCLQEAGRDDAKTTLDIGHENISKSLEEWFADQQLQEAHPTFRTYLTELFGI